MESDKHQSVDAFVAAISSKHRRDIIRTLQDVEDNTMTLDEMVSQLAVTSFESRPHDEIRIVLHHKHLPVLAECDLIEYDHRSGMISLRGDIAQPGILALVNTLDT